MMMPRKQLVLISILSALIVALSAICFILLQQRRTIQTSQAASQAVESDKTEVAQEAPTPTTVEQLLQQLPAGEKVVFFENIPDGVWVVTDPGVTEEEDEMHNRYPRVNVWYLSPESEQRTLVQSHIFQAFSLGDISFEWVTTGSQKYLDLTFRVIGDGPFGWNEFVQDHIFIKDLENYYASRDDQKVIASTSWVDNFSPIFSMDLGQSRYEIQLKAKDGCKGDDDLGVGILVNEQMMNFKTPFPVSCPMFGEGLSSSTLTPLGAPYFHDGNILSFDLPWGTPVDINLDDRTVRSKDFVQDYDLPVVKF